MQWLILHAAKTFACSTPLDSRHFIFTFFFFLVYNSHSVAAALKWRCQGEWVSLMRRFHCPWVLNQQQNCPVKPNQTSSSFCISAGQYLKYTENMKLNYHLKQHHVCSSASIYKFIAVVWLNVGRSGTAQLDQTKTMLSVPAGRMVPWTTYSNKEEMMMLLEAGTVVESQD